MPSFDDQVLALRRSGGYCCFDELAIIEIKGADAGRFLQSRFSNDVLSLAAGQGQITCLLDRKAYILATGYLLRLDERYLLLVEKSQRQPVLELLEEFHFREKLSFKTPELLSFSVHSTKCDLFLTSLTADCLQLGSAEYSVGQATLNDQLVTIVRRSPTGEPGITIFSQAVLPNLARQAQALNLVNLSPEAYGIACIEAGSLGLDLRGISLPESGLENRAVSYTKGCFPGQEVLARIKTYGAPRQGIAGLLLALPENTGKQFNSGKQTLEAGGATQSSKLKTPNDDQRAPLGSDIDNTNDNGTLPILPGCSVLISGAEIGSIYRAVFSPTLKQHIAIAFVQREYRVPDTTLHMSLNGTAYTAKVTTLPFVTPVHKKAEAKHLFDQALQEFAHGSEPKAMAMLKEVIELDPLMPDAYETLGVILSRQDQLDEAISFMKQLTVLDPNSIMAHANLSVFYMQKGDKEAAEEEKALAMSIRMSLMARDVVAQREQEEQKRLQKETATQRMEMFRQVLAIDADDFLANAGLGSVYVDLEQYENALPYLVKALSKKPNHTVAYVALGQAYEKLERTAEALEAYKKGVAVAAQRGDGEPLKAMQIRLNKLSVKATS